MANLPPKMAPQDALLAGTPGDIVKVGVDGIPRYLPEGGGAGGATFYQHSQTVLSNTWVITHNLGFRPNVTVEDSGGSVVEGGITYDSINQLTIDFLVAITGTAFLS
jgi:hypothetical protein